MSLISRFFLAYLALVSSAVAAPASHCSTEEVTYFSCELKNSKVVSICGSPLRESKTLEHPNVAWMQYRFGHIKKIEFAYPASRVDSFLKFEGNDFHPQGEDHSVLDLRFVSGDALYSVELVASAKKISADVSVNLEKKHIGFDCREPIEPVYWNNLSELIGFILEQRGVHGDTDMLSEFYKSHGK